MRIGFFRVDITPTEPVPLDGYGNGDNRISNNVLSPLTATCVAVTDGAEATALLIQMDALLLPGWFAAELRERISAATDVPVEHIILHANHLHTTPQLYARHHDSILRYNETLKDRVTACAAQAMKDRRLVVSAEMAKRRTKGLNFVRHYVLEDGSYKGDNFGDLNPSPYAGHTTEADPEMRLVKFHRAGGKDVLIVNWQSHPHRTGGSKKYDVSADILGVLRDELEQQLGCCAVYFNGASGNINPTSRIPEENANTTNPRNYRVHGELLTMHAKEGLKDMTLLEPGLIKVHTEQFVGECDHTDGSLASAASQVIAYFEEGHTPTETQRFAEPFGIWSVYHARAIGGRAAKGKTLPIPITTFTIGQVGFATIPGELFDTIGMTIKEESPCEMTFIMGYCNGSIGYLASEYAFEYGTYEVDIRTFVKGTAEALGDRHVELLGQLLAK